MNHPDQLVFLTGASSGLGQALALACARRGWRVVLVGRSVPVIQGWVEQQGLEVSRMPVIAADVRDRDSIRSAGVHCLREFGVPDVVIACAGISHGIDPALAEDLEVLDDIVRTNLLGLAATFQPFVTPMKQRGAGTLVGIASVAAVRGLPGHSGYCASKAGVVAYCESLRVELAEAGVKVVTILPGFIDTAMTRGNPYPMPFLLTPQQFAERAIRVIEHGGRWAVIPWPMAWVATLLRWLPRPVYDRLMRGRKRKPRRSAEASAQQKGT
jgi:NAD(P)-dependent dehydrogenase (short-subunit alcohol dehydrogenase family)